MPHLHQKLADLVEGWRANGFPHDAYATIGEILEWLSDSEMGATRYLRSPQIKAVEIYWYLRLVEGTPSVFDLYKPGFPRWIDRNGMIRACFPRNARVSGHFDRSTQWVTGENNYFVFTQHVKKKNRRAGLSLLAGPVD